MSYFGRGALVKYLPKFARDFVHSLQFRPKHPHRMEPGQAANWVPEGPQKVERIKGYRYPAPGSREAARVPRVENTDEVFDTKYYSRDRLNFCKRINRRYLLWKKREKFR